MKKNSIEVRNLSFRYQKEDAHLTLKQVEFHVKQGEWLSIVGHNGSGKSTLVRLLNGLLEAEEGQVLINGQVLSAENIWEKRQEMGIVFQNPDNQFVGATVEDDVAFALENNQVPPEEMQVRVEEALKMVNMWDFRDREPARLSGGQKQRVAVAGILALRPNIIILDEVTSMLDPEGRKELMETIAAIRSQQAITVLSVTHDLEEVSLSDRVLVMKAGRVKSLQTPQELFQRPDLEDLGLDLPFTRQLVEMLDLDVSGYLSEEELQDYLWELQFPR
ncbi:energy-coupling factor transporter ATPase [Streptococcus danieliae]|uniref:Energy-coupling factor transporter ATPase n=1 Tax=Streptococcus danieliae TaxID=747656 RepID=A0A7X3KB27_9STRE|nr:energy-coupling factor transporter ATPase [Streptococcus danieliae]MCU0082213.1 energy-coupling factor transporter ATPase [Streptococcus danieliae]MVX58166.1 energy-coupling factor transporter ATPase [Streptococcus danieliae]NYS32202.1 energy-coupling factor transporter ATPase [Streptococcus danieliae]